MSAPQTEAVTMAAPCPDDLVDGIMVSVVVCVYNDADYLEACLQSLGIQSYPAAWTEILVVDDGSTDGSGEVAERFHGVRLIRQENQGPATARNRGVQQARGRWVAFIDSDCEAEPDWLEKLVAALPELENPPSHGVVAMGGAQKGHSDDPPLAREIDGFLTAIGFIGDYVKPHRQATPVGHNASCNVLYHRRTFLRVGGFRLGVFPGEDVELDRRISLAGGRIHFTPNALVHHHRVNTWAAWRRMLIAYGRASADNVRLHGIFRIIQLIPLLLLPMAAGWGILMAWWPVTAWSVLAVTLLVCGGGAVRISRGSGVPMGRFLLFSAMTATLFTWGFWNRLVTVLMTPPYRLETALPPLADPVPED
ncbi:MAG: glycosyltransferase [Magnetococcales bacterium]|nr:glycosyltransferase [Magnetococcales bacterium]